MLGRSDAADAAAERIGGTAIRADLSDRDDLRRGFADAVEALGALDILVATGTLQHRPVPETSLEHWDDTIEVNLTSVFELCRLAGVLMVLRGSGKIVTIASMLSFQGGFRAAAYSASKGGVAQLTKALANEWAAHGVNVNAIAPGYVKTQLNSHVWRDDPERSEAILARLPPGGGGSPTISRARSSISRPPRRTTSTASCFPSTGAGLAASVTDDRWLDGQRVLVTGAAGVLDEPSWSRPTFVARGSSRPAAVRRSRPPTCPTPR